MRLEEKRGPGSDELNWLVKEDPLCFRAKQSPDRPAVVETMSGVALTYAQFDTYVSRVAAVLSRYLADAEVPVRVAFLGRNSIAQLGFCFACQRVGAVFIPLNWRLSADELAEILEDCGPSLLVYGEEFAAVAGELSRRTGSPVAALEGENGLAAEIEAAVPIAAAYRSADAPCIMLYTSGTTGVPKGVVLSSANVFYSSLNFSLVGEVDPQSVILCELPFFHIIGLVALSRTAMLMGARLVISDRFQPDRTLSVLTDPQLGVTHYCGVPQMASMLREAKGWNPHALSSLKALFLGGAPLPPSLIEKFLEDGIPLVNGYGMSEAGTVCHMPLNKGMVARHPGSIGLPVPLLELKVARDDGEDAGEGAIGEIWLRGPSIMSGYWNKPDETAAAFVNGWYRTGDLAIRRSGVLYLADRLKDMYISGGENVYPAEIEAAIIALPGVRDVAVIGVPDLTWGEIGLAVVSKSDPDLDEIAIAAHCAERLAAYKRPKLIHFTESIPRTASGKVQKHLLRQSLMAKG